MGGLSPLLGIFVAQGVVVFAGISTILGRVYFQAYFETLGIPESAVRVRLADYSIIEPQITLMGIGMATLVPLFFLFLTFFQRARPFDNTRHFIGSILMIAPLILMVGIPPSGATFMVQFAAAFLIPLGGSMIVSAPRLQAALLNIGQSSDQDSSADLRNVKYRAMAGIVLLMVFTMAFLVTKNYSSDFAAIEAELTLQEAPIANIEFDSEAQSLTKGVKECLEWDSGGCLFRVVLLGDRFMYLSPIPHKREMSVSGLYAVPINDVRYIHYLP